MTTYYDEGTIAGRLNSLLVAFEQENPDIVAGLDRLGMQINDYARLLSEFDPPVITTNNTTG